MNASILSLIVGVTRAHNVPILLSERRTLWGDREQIHIQKMEQVHAHDCHQNRQISGHRIIMIQKCTSTFTIQELWVRLYSVKQSCRYVTHS